VHNELIDKLLARAGGWFVLGDALDQCRDATTGAEWATRAVDAIDRIKARGYADTPFGKVLLNEPVS